MDLMTGSYFPWHDYKWGYEVGVQVKNPITSDVFSFIYPMQSLAIQSIKSGQFGLWNPYILSGTPLSANFQSSPFTPLNFLHLFFVSPIAWSLQVVMQHILAGVFTYLLLRHWKVSPWGAFTGGIIYAFSGFMIIWSQWRVLSLACSFVPLVILFADQFFTTHNPRQGILLSVSLALLILSGYPQLFFYTGGAIFLLFTLKVQKKLYVKTLVTLIFFVALGVGISAIQVVPGYELLTVSQRQDETYTDEWAYLPLQKVITFIAPDYFGNHSTANYWGPQNYTSNVGYVGIVAFLLASIGIYNFRKDRNKLFAVLMGILALLMSFQTPLSALFRSIGFLGLQAAAAHRSLFLFNFSIALLAGFGAEYFLSGKYRFNWRVVVLPLGLIIIFVSLAFVEQEHLIIAIESLFLPLAFFFFGSLILFIGRLKRVSLFLLALLATIELFIFAWKYLPFSPPYLFYPTTPVIDFLKSLDKPFRVAGGVLPVNTRMVYGIESFEGYDALYPLRSAEFLSAINNDVIKEDHVRYAIIDNQNSRLIDITNTKYFLTLKDNLTRFDPERYKIVFEDKSTVILENLHTLPRYFTVSGWEVIKDKHEIIARLQQKDFDYKNKIILEEQPPSSASRFLFISDSWYPGWKAYIDSKEQKIYRANYMFRAVEIPQGSQKLTFSYEPDSFKLGAIITTVSLGTSILVYLKLTK